MSFPFFKQLDAMDCGPTCLRMVAKHYGKDLSIVTLRKYCDIQKQGVSMASIADAAEKIGLDSLGVKIELDALLDKDIPLPCILHWKQNHFVVLHKIKGTKRKAGNIKFIVADPATDGSISLDKDTFLKCWLGEGKEGIALLLEPTPAFFEQTEDAAEEQNKATQKVSWAMLGKYLLQHRKYFFQIVLGLLAASLFQLILPFLTQGIVDKGVNMQDINFVYLVLTAQMVLLIGRFIIEFSRQSLLLFISTHINLSLLNDFWKKLMRLPIAYFDSKQTGDIMQRIGDQHKIEQFLTGNSINIVFSMLNLVIYSVVMLLYSVPVFLIFAVGSTLYIIWIALFLRQRRKLNYKQFALASKENSATLQLIYGMQEIKLHNAERHFRWTWERLQRSLYRIGFSNLSLSQMQQAGALFINEGKNLLVTGIVATAVIKGELTLGAMLAIQYILGALNSPVQQLTGFIQQFQDAQISLERLNEIHSETDEPQSETLPVLFSNKQQIVINIKDLCFGYLSGIEDRVLKNIDLEIPAGKTTAIVGMSGSGKTTLLKILQKFYDEKYQGNIIIANEDQHGGMELKKIVPKHWRDITGSVMQDGYIFNESIAGNIAVGVEEVNEEQLYYAAKMANILPFIEELPLGFKTMIGNEGMGVSMGQKQRLLIARAIYKNPKILFFDEATNSLDANNEKVILENLNHFFEGKTVVVVAHRLSTVKHADKIVVLENGNIVEEGTHESLSKQKGKYYELVKNQLELGN